MSQHTWLPQLLATVSTCAEYFVGRQPDDETKTDHTVKDVTTEKSANRRVSQSGTGRHGRHPSNLLPSTAIAIESQFEEIQLTEMNVPAVVEPTEATTIEPIARELNPESAREPVPLRDQPTCCLWTVTRRVFIPFLLAGLGQVVAGFLMNIVTKWPVFKAIPTLLGMLSPFLGMVTNIKSTLTSRLSTNAPIGTFDNWPDLRHFLAGNLKVIQCQATVMSLVTALVSVAVSALRESSRSKLSIQSVLVLCSGSVSTSILANTLLSTLISALIILVRRWGLNTDSILCSLLISAIRDLSSVFLLALITQKLSELDTVWIHLVLISPTLLSPLMAIFAARNRFARLAIIYGWPAMLLSVLVEQPGALAMEGTFERNELASALQPIVNGVARNVLCWQLGQVTNNLKAQLAGNAGVLPTTKLRHIVGPFCSKDVNSRVSHLLLCLTLPCQLFYLSVVYFLQVRSHFTVTLTVPFLCAFFLVILLHVFTLLQVSHMAVYMATKVGYDPDASAVPLISALNNLLGNCATAAMFAFLQFINDPNAGESVKA